VPSPPTKAKAECNNDKGIEKEPELGKEHAWGALHSTMTQGANSVNEYPSFTVKRSIYWILCLQKCYHQLAQY
jgi:hypothetical protein